MGLVLEVPLVWRAPEGHQGYDGDYCDQGRKEVGKLGAEEVRDQELRARERYAAHRDDRQDFEHPPEAGHHRYEHAGNDQGKKRRLTTDHLRELHRVESGDGPGREDRDAESPEGDGGGVRQQRERRGIDRLETEPCHQGARDGDRRSETGRRLEECPENEGDEDDLYAPVVAHAGERVPYGVEEASIYDDVVDEYGVDHVSILLTQRSPPNVPLTSSVPPWYADTLRRSIL